MAVLLPSTLGAQAYAVREYTVDDGLPSGDVHAIDQGPDGALWLATRAGVARYDGTAWRVFNLRHGFRAADQLDLTWDAEGALWSVGRQAPFDLSRYDGLAWVRRSGPGERLAGRRVRAFAWSPSPAGPLLVLATDGGIVYQRAGRWYGPPSGALADQPIVALTPTLDGMVVATVDRLYRFDGRTVTAFGPESLPGPLAAVARTLVDPETATGAEQVHRRWWLAGRDWLAAWHPDDGWVTVPSVDRASTTSTESARSSTVTLEPDGYGGTFVVQGGSLHHVAPLPNDGGPPVRRDLSTLVEHPGALFLDREHNLWVAGRGGVRKLVRRPFSRLQGDHGLLADEVTAIAQRADGTLVFGHPGGLTFHDPGTGSMTTLPWSVTAVDQGDRVWDLAETPQGELLIAGGRNGLGRLDRDGSLHWHRVGATPDEIVSVTAVVVAEDGAAFVGTERSLLRFDAGGALVPADRAPDRVHIRALGLAQDGAPVLSTPEGLVVIRDDRVERWSCDAPVGCGSVFAALEIDPGTFWVGTAAGLFVTVGDELVPVRQPAVDRPVYFLFGDGADHRWIGTDNGALHWDGALLRAFTVRDGLAGRETNRAAWQVDDRGRVWLGAEGGAAVFDGDDPTARPGLPLLLFDEVRAGGVSRSLSEGQRLAHDENDLIIRFRAVSLLDEDRNQVASRLEGFEDDWSAPQPADRVAEVRYTNLPPGRYRFHAKAVNAHGVWSAPRVSASIVIDQPFWMTPWFLLLGVGVAAAVVWASQRLFSHRRYARKLEREVDERVAETLTEKERLAVTLRNIDDGVLTTDENGAIIFLNPVAHELLGVRPGEAIGQPLGAVLRLRWPTGDQAPYDPFALLEARDIEALEQAVAVELTPRDGAPRLVEISGSPIVAARGRLAGLVLAFRDVTERQRIEQELAKGRRLEALGLLAGGIAHDFNNLLTVMLGSISMVDRGDLVTRQKKLLRDAESAVLRARDLTQQLLTFSRGGAPVRAAAAIGEVVRESASFVLSGANVRAEVELPDDLWVVDIDTGQISQVINNLLINATQAMPDGGIVRITGSNVLGVTVPLPRERYVVLAVADEGMGIPAEHLDRIFDPYFSTKDEGRGLGLASAYSIAKRHDGLLTVTSTPGTGTIFHLYLPASNTTVPKAERSSSSRQPAAGRILIMDDDRGVRTMMGAMVETLGYGVHLTADGGEAVEAYRAAKQDGMPFDAVIMDLTVRGGMGGKEAIRRLNELDPDVRAIVASGYSNDPVMADHRKYGFRGRITKPFPPDRLARALDELLAGESVT